MRPSVALLLFLFLLAPAAPAVERGALADLDVLVVSPEAPDAARPGSSEEINDRPNQVGSPAIVIRRSGTRE